MFRPILKSLFVAEVVLPVLDNLSITDETHWTVTKLVGWLKTEKDLVIPYGTRVRYLHEHDYKLKVPRPIPEPPDREAREDQREDFVRVLFTRIEDESCDLFSETKRDSKVTRGLGESGQREEN